MADLTIFGGGIFGLAIGWECARRGAKVQLIERARIGAGASGGIVGALAPHVPENWNAKKEFQLQSLLMAEDFWAGVRAASGLDPGYARLGRLQPLADQAAVAHAHARAAGAAALWRGRADWRVEPGGDIWRGVSPTGLWVFDSLSARLHPRMATSALAAAIRAAGGSVTEMETSADGHWPGPVVWATGAAGLAALSSDLGRTVGTGVKGQAALFACAAQGQAQLFADGLHVVPHADGTAAVGSTTERDFASGDETDGGLDALIEKARALSPMLAAAPVIERWAGVRPRAASRAPVLGRWPGRPGHFIANGGFKIGFGMAPGVARTMADLVLEGRDTVPPGFRIEDCL